MTDEKRKAIEHVTDTINYISSESDEIGFSTTIGKVKGQIELLIRIQMITNDEAGELYKNLDTVIRPLEQKFTRK